jgi:hypothetical protein
MQDEKQGQPAEEPPHDKEPKAFEVAFNGPTDHGVLASEPGELGEPEDTSEA